MRFSSQFPTRVMPLVALLLTWACQKPFPADSWRNAVKPHAVSADEVQSDPERSASKAIAARDWRLIRLAGSSKRFPGLVCSVPDAVLELATIIYPFRSPAIQYGSERDAEQVLPAPGPATRRQVERFNRAVAFGPDSPWAGLCLASESWTVPVEPEPWALIAPPPADSRKDLMTIARLGLPDARNIASRSSWDHDRRDLFGMTSLSWAVVRDDKDRVAWMVRRPFDDSYEWCQLAHRRGRDPWPRAWIDTDPLVLAVRRDNIEMVRLLMPVRSERKCLNHGEARSDPHPMFQKAWDAALNSKREAIVALLLPEYAAADEEMRARLAETLRLKGFESLAASAYFAAPEPEQTPLARAARACDHEAASFWLARSRERRRDTDVRVAWRAFQETARWDRPEACLAVMRAFIAEGARVDAGSNLIAAAVQADLFRTTNAVRPDSPAPATAAEAAELIALFRRAGGNPDAPVKSGNCPKRWRRGPSPLFCTPGELASRGRTAYAALLAPPRPSADVLVYDAMHNSNPLQYFETPIDEARRTGCLTSNDDPLARSIVQSCLARDGEPLIVERRAQLSNDDLCWIDPKDGRNMDRQLKACPQRGEPIYFK